MFGIWSEQASYDDDAEDSGQARELEESAGTTGADQENCRSGRHNSIYDCGSLEILSFAAGGRMIGLVYLGRGMMNLWDHVRICLAIGRALCHLACEATGKFVSLLYRQKAILTIYSVV